MKRTTKRQLQTTDLLPETIERAKTGDAAALDIAFQLLRRRHRERPDIQDKLIELATKPRRRIGG